MTDTKANGQLLGEHAAMLWAVLERPSEDGPRLLYADWLEEKGDPIVPAKEGFAEFIRVQVALEKTPKILHRPGTVIGFQHSPYSNRLWLKEPVENPRWDELKKREKELFKWDRLYYGTGDHQYINVTLSHFRRGLVEVVNTAIALASWLSMAEHIITSAPITRVGCYDKQPVDLSNGYAWLKTVYYDRQLASAAGRGYLPDKVFDKLRVGNVDNWSYKTGKMRACYPTPEEAQKDLSDTLVDMAREEAGLPLLKPWS
jgi:uncharacterized protein (TIGR02996 family)